MNPENWKEDLKKEVDRINKNNINSINKTNDMFKDKIEYFINNNDILQHISK